MASEKADPLPLPLPLPFLFLTLSLSLLPLLYFIFSATMTPINPYNPFTSILPRPKIIHAFFDSQHKIPALEEKEIMITLPIQSLVTESIHLPLVSRNPRNLGLCKLGRLTRYPARLKLNLQIWKITISEASLYSNQELSFNSIGRSFKWMLWMPSNPSSSQVKKFRSTPKTLAKKRKAAEKSETDSDFQKTKKKKISGKKGKKDSGKSVSGKKKQKKATKQFAGFRSTFNGIISLVENFQKEGRITREHINCLDSTPFGKFFRIFLDKRIDEKMIKKSYKSISYIIKFFSEKEEGFRFGKSTKIVKITPEFISVLFGIPMSGYRTNVCGKFSSVTEFEKKFFVERSLDRVVRKTTVEKLLKEQILKHEEEEIQDLVKLFLMYCWGTLFNPQAGGTIPRAFIANISTMKMINSICWPKVIHSHLLTSLKKLYSKPTSVSGCVYVLLYMLAEYTTISKPILGRETSEPRVTRWRLDEFANLQMKEKLKALTDAEILTGKEDYSKEEKDLLKLDEEVDVLSDKEVEEDVTEKKSNIICLEEEKENLLKLKEEQIITNEELKRLVEFYEKEKLREEELRKANEAFENEKKKLQSHVDGLFNQIGELTEKKKQLESEFQREEVSSVGEDIQNKIEGLLDDKKELENKLHETLSQLKQLKESEADLKKEIGVLREEKVLSEVDINLFKMHVKNEENAKEEALKRVAELEAENQLLREHLLKGFSQHKPCSKEKLDLVMEQKRFKMLCTQYEQKVPVEDLTQMAQEKVKAKRNIKQQSFFHDPVPIQFQELETPRESQYWSLYTTEEKNTILLFYALGSPIKQVWSCEEPPRLIQISGKLLDDLLYDEWIDYQIIDWYLLYDLKGKAESAELNYGAKDSFAVVPTNVYDMYKIGQSRDEAVNQMYAELKKQFKRTTQYVFVPMRTTENHFTLLYCNLDTMKFHHYNSLGRTMSKGAVKNPHIGGAVEFRKVVQNCIKDTLAAFIDVSKLKFKLSMQLDIEGPQQKNGYDCAIYVCRYVVQVLNEGPDAGEKFTEEDVKKLKASIAVRLLMDPENSWHPGRDADYLDSVMVQKDEEEQRNKNLELIPYSEQECEQ